MPEQHHGPITPAEAAEQHDDHIPDEVFIAFNGLIAQKLYRGRAVVYTREVLARLVEAGLDHRTIYENHWLDVEPSYQKAGWKVTYDQPAYNETYEAYFEFTAPK